MIFFVMSFLFHFMIYLFYLMLNLLIIFIAILFSSHIYQLISIFSSTYLFSVLRDYLTQI